MITGEDVKEAFGAMKAILTTDVPDGETLNDVQTEARIEEFCKTQPTMAMRVILHYACEDHDRIKQTELLRRVLGAAGVEVDL